MTRRRFRIVPVTSRGKNIHLHEDIVVETIDTLLRDVAIFRVKGNLTQGELEAAGKTLREILGGKQATVLLGPSVEYVELEELPTGAPVPVETTTHVA